jgi:glycosyltransferase involved in cell wall biosynthesis
LSELRIAAFIAVRNQADYLRRTLPHLADNGISVVVIDNQSTDGLREVVDDQRRAGAAIALEYLPFHGSFDLSRQLEAKASLIEQSDADWVLHLDADEMPHSCREGETLAAAIARADAAGYNVVNFEEFVFLPIEPGPARDEHAFFPFTHYYFFEPSKLRLMRAWRRICGFTNVDSGGHHLRGEDTRIFPENQVLRHYPFLSQQHAWEKYSKRRFNENDLARGWHGNRIDIDHRLFTFPAPGELELLEALGRHALDRSRPHTTHYWQWAPAGVQ